MPLLCGLPNPGEAAPAYEEEDVYDNVLPWQPAQSAARSSEELRLRYHRVRQELKRCEEELTYLAGDAVRVIAYYVRQLGLIEQWILQQPEAHADIVPTAIHGRIHIMHLAQKRLCSKLKHALATFASCGWLSLGPA
jgi:hypothetical protein